MLHTKGHQPACHKCKVEVLDVGISDKPKALCRAPKFLTRPPAAHPSLFPPPQLLAGIKSPLRSFVCPPSASHGPPPVPCTVLGTLQALNKCCPLI